MGYWKWLYNSLKHMLRPRWISISKEMKLAIKSIVSIVFGMCMFSLSIPIGFGEMEVHWSCAIISIIIGFLSVTYGVYVINEES